MRGTWVMRGGEIVQKGGPKDIRPSVARSSLPRPMVISDSLDAVQSMVSGERFESKSNLRRHYRDNCVIEVGNETIKPRDNDDIPIAPIEKAVAEAFETLS